MNRGVSTTPMEKHPLATLYKVPGAASDRSAKQGCRKEQRRNGGPVPHGKHQPHKLLVGTARIEPATPNRVKGRRSQWAPLSPGTPNRPDHIAGNGHRRVLHRDARSAPTK